MLAAKEGCLDAFELMLHYVEYDEACTEGGAPHPPYVTSCRTLRLTLRAPSDLKWDMKRFSPLKRTGSRSPFGVF
eukprot:5007399-Pyramimonas_sp.AAC.1